MKARKVPRSEFRLAGIPRSQIDQTLKEFNIRRERKVFRDKSGNVIEKALLITHCCRTKLASGLPTSMYVGDRNLRFYEGCRKRRERYAILSDLYGIHFDDEHLDYYDKGPGQLTDEDLWECGRLIGVKMKERGLKSLHYVASPPSCAVPYLIMLMASGIDFSYDFKLPSMEKVGLFY